ncbi:hypothetical protein XBI1_1420105 [Xenorhabdus bovienii str. Intermedium]|uniref:Uncharacterized protein n=1 Tax=Xenorhabdus bovienii str. Intermedium TaxID=1379677 RepID=A0A077Q5I0_XENBV|nr:hypothetical protein XBI1_1420105 [Xenorhabdus bovienii str. Intermedium]
MTGWLLIGHSFYYFSVTVTIVVQQLVYISGDDNGIIEPCSDIVVGFPSSFGSP